MKKGVEIKLTLSNRAIYTLIILGIFSILAVGVYAVAGLTPNPGHALSELQACSDGEILGFDGGWDCISVSNLESDPTVQSWAKSSNPTISGTLSATALKSTGSATTGGSCSSSQWGEIRRCSYSGKSTLCSCVNLYGSWQWGLLIS